MIYQYPHFRRELMLEDDSFNSGPQPGELFPDFELTTTEDTQVRKEDFQGSPLLITLASCSCPMTADASPGLRQLYTEFGSQVRFLSLYVREAHPGERYFQPETFQQKMAFARDYQSRDQIPWTVAVDDIEGSLHRALDEKPNSAYLLDQQGRVVQRILWSNDIGAVRVGLQAITSGQPPSRNDYQRKLVPMLRGVGQMYEVLDSSGLQARRDVLREAPPLYAMARLAHMFRPLPPLGRGIAAVTVASVTVMAVGFATWKLIRKHS